MGVKKGTPPTIILLGLMSGILFLYHNRVTDRHRIFIEIFCCSFVKNGSFEICFVLPVD